jgi:hypothetical protein
MEVCATGLQQRRRRPDRVGINAVAGTRGKHRSEDRPLQRQEHRDESTEPRAQPRVAVPPKEGPNGVW